MKKVTKIVMLFALLAATFIGCKKDETEITPTYRIATSTYFSDGEMRIKHTYTYDTQGRLTKDTDFDGSYTSFTYSGTSVTVTYHNTTGTITSTDIVTLNSKGYFSSLGTDSDVTTFTYDNDGHLTNIKNSDFETKQTWSNGNKISSVQGIYTYNFTYSDKINTIDEFSGLMGKPSKNLIATVTNSYSESGTLPQSTSYNYEFDSKNRVIKQTETEGSWVSYTTYTYIE